MINKYTEFAELANYIWLCPLHISIRTYLTQNTYERTQHSSFRPPSTILQAAR